MSGPSSAPWGALFDWDGVIVNSSRLHEQAWNDVAGEFGYPHGPEDFKRHFGSRNERAIKALMRWTQDDEEVARISERKEVLYRNALANAGNVVLPGVVEFLALLAQRSVLCAVVSSSPRLNIETVLQGSELGGAFQRVVAAEDVRRGKPDPEGFCLGAASLGLPPERCVVFEDAPAGIEAGRKGGMRTVALTTTHERSALQMADHVVARLDERLLGTLVGWFAAAGASGER